MPARTDVDAVAASRERAPARRARAIPAPVGPPQPPGARGTPAVQAHRALQGEVVVVTDLPRRHGQVRASAMGAAPTATNTARTRRPSAPDRAGTGSSWGSDGVNSTHMVSRGLLYAVQAGVQREQVRPGQVLHAGGQEQDVREDAGGTPMGTRSDCRPPGRVLCRSRTVAGSSRYSASSCCGAGNGSCCACAELPRSPGAPSPAASEVASSARPGARRPALTSDRGRQPAARDDHVQRAIHHGGRARHRSGRLPSAQLPGHQP